MGVAVGLTDLFYAFMAFPAMGTILALSGHVRRAAKAYFSNTKPKTAEEPKNTKN